MKIPLRILHLEDTPHDRALVQAIFEAEGIACVIQCVETRSEFLAALEEGAFDLILADHTLPTFDGLSALSMTRAKRPDLPFLFVTGSMGEELAIETMKNGATDYVLKNRMPPCTRKLKSALMWCWP